MEKNDSKTEISLEELVNNIMQEKNHNPRDFCFRYVVSEYPKEAHEIFDFPGEYLDTCPTDAFTEDGRNLVMDCAQLIMPKGDITCKSTINVEHQTSPLIQEKIGIMYDYKLYLINQTNLPSNSIVITNIDTENQVIYCESHDQIFKIHYIVLDEENISKRLSMLTNKIESKEKLSRSEALNITVVAIFVKKEFGKDTLEKLSFLFSQIEEIEEQLQYDIHHVLKKMIRYYFSDDEAKCKELLFMITEAVFRQNPEGLTPKETYERRIAKLYDRIEIRDSLREKDALKIQERDRTIEERDRTIDDQQKRIIELEKQLSMQNGLVKG